MEWRYPPNLKSSFSSSVFEMANMNIHSAYIFLLEEMATSQELEQLLPQDNINVRRIFFGFLDLRVD